MERGNVLVIGNSGVGKSTLINAVLGSERASTGYGTSGTTHNLEIYEGSGIPFRIIDTVGFEPSLIKEYKAINAVKLWSKNCAKKGHEDSKINVIWICVEGTSSKLFPKTIKDIARATDMWKSVPIIVVITKSYSVPEREQNIEMVRDAFNSHKEYGKNLKLILPVVASTYTINEKSLVPPEGITELIEATNEIMPEGIKAGAKDLYKFKLHRKKALGQGVVGVSTTAAATVGAVPIPFADALILSPIEMGEVNALAQLYEIDKNEDSKKLFDAIVEVGTVSVAAKAVISGLKAIPGIDIAASVINAITAGCIVAAIGEGSRIAFEKIYTGEKTIADVEWVKKLIEGKLSTQIIEKATEILENIGKNEKPKDIKKMVGTILASVFSVKK